MKNFFLFNLQTQYLFEFCESAAAAATNAECAFYYYYFS
jgi:hypothetical protein